MAFVSGAEENPLPLAKKIIINKCNAQQQCNVVSDRQGREEKGFGFCWIGKERGGVCTLFWYTEI